MENGISRKAPPMDLDEADPRSKVKQKAVFKESGAPEELLAGEVVLAQVRSTLKYRPLSELSHGTIGVLFATNYKLSFVPADRSSYDLTEDREQSPPPVVSDSSDIPLTRIAQVWTSDETGARRKQLSHGMRAQGDVGLLEIFCKDFFRISFGFKFARKQDVTLLISSLTVYAFPTSITRVFAFDHAGSLARRKSKGRLETPLLDSCNVCTFRSEKDWQKELDRLNANDKWRISAANEQFALCESLPAFVVCPATVRDTDLFSAAVCHKHGRMPTWCWSHRETGVALLRSACRKIVEKNSVADGNLRQALDNSSFWSGKLQVVNLDKCCPSAKDFQVSFEKLQDLCTFDSIKDWQTDSRWLLNLGNTQWMASVKACLDAASTAASLLHERKDSVLIEDSDGRDLACAVTSLTQIIVDPHYRTVKGLQELIQKEWVVAGHRFATRCAHLVESTKKHHTPGLQSRSSFSLPRKPSPSGSKESTWYDTPSPPDTDTDADLEPQKRERLSTSPVKGIREYDVKKSKSFSAAAGNDDDPGSEIKKHSPVFLLFLDCVHQLTIQFPTAFEYTEFFLRYLWTASYSCVYDTFLFDSDLDRRKTLGQLSPITAKSVQLTLSSAWHAISKVFEAQAEIMRNPLYGLIGWKSDFCENPMHTQPTFLDGNTGLYSDNKRHNVPTDFRISSCLFPNTSQAGLKFWSTGFFQWVTRAHAVDGERTSSLTILRQVAKEIQWLLDKPGVAESIRKVEKKPETGKNVNQQQFDNAPQEEEFACVSDVNLTLVHESFPRSRVYTDPSPRRRPKPKVPSSTRRQSLERDSLNCSLGNFTDEVLELIQQKGNWDSASPWKKEMPKEGQGSLAERELSPNTPFYV